MIPIEKKWFRRYLGDDFIYMHAYIRTSVVCKDESREEGMGLWELMGSLRPLYSLPPVLSLLSASQVAAVTGFLLLDNVCSCCPGLWRHWASFSLSAVVTCLVPIVAPDPTSSYWVDWFVSGLVRVCRLCSVYPPHLFGELILVWHCLYRIVYIIHTCVSYTFSASIRDFFPGVCLTTELPVLCQLTDMHPRARIPEATFHCILSGFVPLIPM